MKFTSKNRCTWFDNSRAIENLLKAGFQPRFYTVNSGRIGLITFTDKNGTKQVPPGRKEKH